MGKQVKMTAEGTENQDKGAMKVPVFLGVANNPEIVSVIDELIATMGEQYELAIMSPKEFERSFKQYLYMKGNQAEIVAMESEETQKNLQGQAEVYFEIIYKMIEKHRDASPESFVLDYGSIKALFREDGKKVSNKDIRNMTDVMIMFDLMGVVNNEGGNTKHHNFKFTLLVNDDMRHDMAINDLQAAEIKAALLENEINHIKGRVNKYKPKKQLELDFKGEDSGDLNVTTEAINDRPNIIKDVEGIVDIESTIPDKAIVIDPEKKIVTGGKIIKSATEILNIKSHS